MLWCPAESGPAQITAQSRGQSDAATDREGALMDRNGFGPVVPQQPHYPLHQQGQYPQQQMSFNGGAQPGGYGGYQNQPGWGQQHPQQVVVEQRGGGSDGCLKGVCRSALLFRSCEWCCDGSVEVPAAGPARRVAGPVARPDITNPRRGGLMAAVLACAACCCMDMLC